jgi:hypothetical protein
VLWLDRRGSQAPRRPPLQPSCFSPESPQIWSGINIAHIARLRKLGLMERRGVEVFDNRDPAPSGVYSFE